MEKINKQKLELEEQKQFNLEKINKMRASSNTSSHLQPLQ